MADKQKHKHKSDLIFVLSRYAYFYQCVEWNKTWQGNVLSDILAWPDIVQLKLTGGDKSCQTLTKLDGKVSLGNNTWVEKLDKLS